MIGLGSFVLLACGGLVTIMVSLVAAEEGFLHFGKTRFVAGLELPDFSDPSWKLDRRRVCWVNGLVTVGNDVNYGLVAVDGMGLGKTFAAAYYRRRLIRVQMQRRLLEHDLNETKKLIEEERS